MTANGFVTLHPTFKYWNYSVVLLFHWIVTLAEKAGEKINNF